MEKETICWNCRNYSRCSWSRGKPVKGWKATPTKVENVIDGYLHVVNSFLVEDCPHFKPDKKQRVYFADIAKIIGTTTRYAYRLKEVKGIGRLKDLLQEKGYKLHVCKGDERCEYYLEKIDT